MSRAEQRLRAEYVDGSIEIEEFERRLGALMRGRPEPKDARPIFTDEPGTIWPYQAPMTARDAAMRMALVHQKIEASQFRMRRINAQLDELAHRYGRARLIPTEEAQHGDD